MMATVLKTLAGAISSFAPTLAAMLGGPLAGTAVAALEGAFGLSPGSGADAITKVIQTGSMTPETIAAVRAADQKHAEIMGQQGIDLVKLNSDHEEAFAKTDELDRESARQRQVSIKDNTPAVLAYIIIGGFFAFSVGEILAFTVWADAMTKIPGPAWAIIGNIGGYLAYEAKAASAFFFGDTAASGKKTDALVDIAKS